MATATEIRADERLRLVWAILSGPSLHWNLNSLGSVKKQRRSGQRSSYQIKWLRLMIISCTLLDNRKFNLVFWSLTFEFRVPDIRHDGEGVSAKHVNMARSSITINSRFATVHAPIPFTVLSAVYRYLRWALDGTSTA